MRRLSLVVLLVAGLVEAMGQSPHGDKFQMDCKVCHSPEGWKVEQDKLSFNHDETGFSLIGQHANTNCVDCHNTLVFEEAESNCISCHIDVHNMTVGDDCLRCHTTDNWLVDNIPELHEQNGFPLFGAHDMLTCNDCHQSESSVEWKRIGGECVDCHLDQYYQTTDPNHVASGFSTDCLECHLPVEDQWGGTNFHAFFPLTQGHNVKDCNECHNGSNYEDISRECVSCHLDDYASTQNPNHQSVGFDTECYVCHTTTPGWSPAYLDGNEFHDFFPLTEGHDIQDCKACHKSDQYSDISSECVSCHLADYNSAQNPNHQAANFSTDCIQCHTASPTWNSSTIGGEDFHDFFPLTDGHDIQDCTACHSAGTYAGLSPECVTCHIKDYNSTQNPDHQSAGFSTDCTQCHTTSPNWTPSSIGSGDFHDFFPLTKGHNLQQCSLCHTTGNYADASSECISCHQSDFDNTRLPDHNLSNISTNCTTCHTTDLGWNPVRFTAHDNQHFPIYSGKHKGKWSSCTECHVDQSNYSTFSCIDCHEHSNESRVNSDHKGVRNYSYESSECYRCHPTGRD